MMIFDSCVVTRLMYGLQSAWLNQAERRRIDGFHARCLRCCTPGPGSNLWTTCPSSGPRPKIRAAMGTDAVLVPLSAMADGNAVIEVMPVSPTRVYHLACENHEALLAAGLEVESFHPGPETPLSLPDEMLQLFMQFFPHLSSVRDFGRLTAPRITANDFLRLTD